MYVYSVAMYQLSRHCQGLVPWKQLDIAYQKQMWGGIRRRVAALSRLPDNWQHFLRINANITELFAFLVKCISHMVVTKQIVITNGNEVLCIPPQDTSSLAPCNHDEADTRMCVHLACAVTKCFNKILLHTVDTDVVVLALVVAGRVNV